VTDDLRLPLDDGLGPAPPITNEHADALIAAAIRTHAIPDPVRVLRPRRPRWVFLAAAAALMLVIGTALAAVLPRIFRAPPPAIAPAVTATTEATAPIVSAPEIAPAPTETEPAPSATVAPKEIPSADLLRRANDQRKKHQWKDAETTYESVIARSPHGEDGYTATVAAASLRLEHMNDPKTALRLYRVALSDRPNGSLSEEAHWGVAECQRALKDHQGEIDALHAFVAAHPDGVMRQTADQRLTELGEK
jgi:hypothetical protein